MEESARGPLRQDDRASDRRRAHRHRPVRRRTAPAVERRRACRSLLPRLSQCALPVHRRQAAAGGADRGGRDRRRPAVHPPPRRVRPGFDARTRVASRRSCCPPRRQELSRPSGPTDPFHRRLHRPGLGRPRDPRAVERREPADHDLSRDEDRADLVHAALGAHVHALRLLVARLEVPGAARPDTEPLLAELRVVKILVTGGTGFVGPKIIHALRAEERDVRALVRRPDRARRLADWGVETVTGDVTDPASLRVALAGCTHVVHLVALIAGRPEDFDRVMTQGTRNLLQAAGEAGVERFVLMSALGTSEATRNTVPYFRAKWEMEHAVRDSGLEHTIFRPSFVFGRDGGVLPTFVKQVRYAPVVSVIGPGTQRIQPVWVEDVAACFAQSVDLPAAANRTFEIGGLDVVTWDGLYRTIAKVLGKRRPLVHVPIAVARAGARLTQWAPGAPLTTDQIAMLAGPDNVVTSNDAVETFVLPLVALDEQIRRAA